jgi:hypothetical protein
MKSVPRPPQHWDVDQRSRARDRTTRIVTDVGRRQWKKASGYNRQARAENAFFRYKSILAVLFEVRCSHGL